MSNIIPFNANNEVPAHLAALFDADSNIAARSTIDQLSYRGKVWRRIVDGEEVQLTRTNGDGDVEPMPIVSLVILDHNKNRSRAYYPGQYEEGKNAAPLCWSSDGITPDASVKEPQAKTCATCQWAVKGSKITESGKQSTACSPFKRVAVVPSQAIGKHVPMLLRLAQTSVWDKDNGENEAKGWYAWDQYLDMLRARGVKHTAAVETKVKFDLRMAYPKLLFSAARWLNPEEATAAKGRLTDDADAITSILNGGAADGVADTPAAPAATPASQAATTQADVDKVAAAAAQVEAEKKAKAAAARAAKKAAADKALAEAQAAAVAAAAEDEGDSGDGDAWGVESAAPAATTQTAAQPAASAASTPVAAPAVVEGTPAGLADLLSNWDA